MNLNDKFIFDNFLVDEGNKLAFVASKQVIDELGRFNPFFIYGPAGCGKTHLVHAIGNEIIKKCNKNVLYVSSEELVEEFISTNYKEFQNKYYSVDVLIIDDAQLLKGMEQLENELLNMLNTQNFSDKQLIFTSDRCIPDLDFKSELTSKLHCGLEVNIYPPSLSLKKEFIQTIIKEYDIELTDEIIDFIARNTCCKKDIQDSLTVLLVSIIETNDKINLDGIKKILKEFIKNDIHEPNIDYKENILGIIKNEVAAYYHISIQYMNMRIKGNNRKKNVTEARQMAIYIAKELMTRDRIIVVNSFKMYNKTTFHFIADSFGLYDTVLKTSAGALVSHIWADFSEYIRNHDKTLKIETNKIKLICDKKIKNEIEKIIKRVDIVDIIKNYIPLEKRGKNYFGICPFHKDSKPSLSVSPEKQMYKCFSCGASGNVADFANNYDIVKMNERIEKYFGDD